MKVETLLGSRLSRREIGVLQSGLPNDTSEKEIIRLLKIRLPIFDKLFFFNLMERGLKQPQVRLYYTSSKDKISQSTAGYYSQKRIYINLSDFPEDDENTCVERRIGTLLHEMVHAYLGRFACNCKGCKN